MVGSFLKAGARPTTDFLPIATAQPLSRMLHTTRPLSIINPGVPLDYPMLQPIEEDVREEPKLPGNAIRWTAVGRLRNFRAAPEKMKDICRPIRGLSVDEALLQLRFSGSKKFAPALAKVVKNAAQNAEHNFFMDRKRLVIGPTLGEKKEKWRFLL